MRPPGTPLGTPPLRPGTAPVRPLVGRPWARLVSGLEALAERWVPPLSGVSLLVRAGPARSTSAGPTLPAMAARVPVVAAVLAAGPVTPPRALSVSGSAAARV